MPAKPSREATGLGPLASANSGTLDPNENDPNRQQNISGVEDEEQIVPEPDRGVKVSERMLDRLDDADREELEQLRAMRDNGKMADRPLNRRDVSEEELARRERVEKKHRIDAAVAKFHAIVADYPSTAPASHTVFGRAVGTITVGELRLIDEVMGMFGD